jgi:hypothetical protein
MSIPRMRAVEYNAWMSLLSYIPSAFTQDIAADYGLSNIDISVIPSYPKDITKFSKPSIIVQRIHTIPHAVGFGNVLGVHEDEDGIHDVKGTIFDMLYQINIEANSNTQCGRITSVMLEKILNKITDTDEPLHIVLNDHIGDTVTAIGRMDMIGDIQVVPVSSNDNKDYMDTIRVEFITVQSRLVDTEMIDLSKPIQWNQTIKL